MSAKTKILRTQAKRPGAVISGCGRFLTTEHTEHTEKNPCTVMPCFRVFGVFRGSPVFDNKTEHVVAAPASHAGFRSLKITSFWARRMPSIAVSVEALDCGTAERWQASSPTTLRPLRSNADRQHTSKKLAMSWAQPRAAQSPSPARRHFSTLPKHRFAVHLGMEVRPVASQSLSHPPPLARALLAGDSQQSCVARSGAAKP